MSLSASPARDESLEALRGLAAIVILLGHTTISFFPSLYGVFGESDPAFALSRTPFFAAINAQAAVTFTFVLSGFVLTRRYFTTHDSDIVWRGMIKRWPRLAGPALISVIAGWAGFMLGIYWYREASALFKTPWLESFGAGSPDPSIVYNFGFAVADGAVLSFVRRGSMYNSVLWTMTYALSGSLMILMLAVVAVKFRHLHAGLRAMLALIAFVVAGHVSPLFAALPVVGERRQANPRVASGGVRRTAACFLSPGLQPGSQAIRLAHERRRRASIWPVCLDFRFRRRHRLRRRVSRLAAILVGADRRISRVDGVSDLFDTSRGDLLSWELCVRCDGESPARPLPGAIRLHCLRSRHVCGGASPS
jgi:peptidoglycan/LPS O-acetylase OafA/YrhL